MTAGPFKKATLLSVVLLLLTGLMPAVAQATESEGFKLLEVHDNPRYLKDKSGQAVVLSGSHTWAVFQDYINVPSGEGGPDPLFNYDGTQGAGNFNNSWLGRLQAWNHNFFRGWHWEDGYYAPWPYLATDSGGTECDPHPDTFDTCRFDLEKINPDYLTQLKQRVESAVNPDPEDPNRTHSFYTSVQFFQGWSVTDDPQYRDPIPWTFHPYKAGNHWNLTPPITAETTETHEFVSTEDMLFKTQTDYVAAVVDHLAEGRHEDPTLWESIIWQVTNESHDGSGPWQFKIAEFLQAYEMQEFGQKHLVWIDCFDDDKDNGTLFVPENPAELISPCRSGGYQAKGSQTNPPAATGAKVVIADSDHLGPNDINRWWVWKSFFRGLHPITMDAWTQLTWFDGELHEGHEDWWKLIEAREAMGGVVLLADPSIRPTWAQDTGLADLVPQARNDDSPSDLEYALYRPDGLEIMAYHWEFDTDALVTICELLPGRTYLRWELVLVDAEEAGRFEYELKSRQAKIADGSGCVDLSRGSDEDTVHWLLTGDPPSIVSGPEPRQATLGQDATFTVIAEGGGTLSYQWQRDSGGWVDLTDGSKYSGVQSPELTISSVVFDDEGDYRCVVSSEFPPPVESQAADLMVLTSTIVARDLFTNTTGSATALDGRQAAAGGLTWEATSKLEVSPSGTVTTQGGSPINQVGTVPFDPTLTNEVVTLAADIDPRGSQWTAIGFSETATGSFNTDGELWVFIREDDPGFVDWIVRIDGQNRVAGARIPGEFAYVEIDYDPLTTDYTVRVEGLEVHSGNLETHPEFGFSPAISYAGMHLRNGTQDQTKVDNFELRRQPAFARDAFTSAGTTPLDGRQAAAGGLTWEATSKLEVSPSGTVTTQGGNPINQVGTLPFDPTLTNEVVTLAADIDPQGSQWTAVGFSETTTGPFNTDAELWVFVEEDPPGSLHWAARADGNTFPLATDRIPGYVTGEFAHVEIDYDPLTTGYVVRVEGDEVTSGNLEADLGLTPAISHAGMHLRNGTRNQTEVDNFELRPR